MATGTINNISITKILIDSKVVSENGTYTIPSTENYSLLYIEFEGNVNNIVGHLTLNNRNSVFTTLDVPATSTIKVSCNINILLYSTLSVSSFNSQTWTQGILRIYGVIIK